MSLANLVPEGMTPTPEQADVLLELAWLTTAIDGHLDDAEISAFESLAARLRGKAKVTPAERDALFDKFGGNVEHEEITERVKAIAPGLPKELKPIAFKLAVGLSVADLDTNEDETDLQVMLAEALGLDETTVDTLTAEVYATLDAGED
jgi:hypothetical protein